MNQLKQLWRQLRVPVIAGLVFAYALVALSMIIDGDLRGLINTTLAFSPVLVFVPTFLQMKYHALTHPAAFIAGERGARTLQEGRIREALPLLERATRLNPTLGIHFHNLGLAYFALAYWDEAHTQFDRAIACDAHAHPSYTMRANVHLIQRDLESALADIDRAIAIKPKYVIAYALRGVIQQQRDDLDAAIESFETCIRLEPRFVEAYLNLGAAYADRGDRARAIELYTQAIDIDPQYGLAYNNRANELARRGELDSALRDAQHSIRFTPDHPTPYSTRGMIYFLMQRYTQAVNDFQQSRRIQSTYHFATAGLAAAYHALGSTVNVEESVRLWRLLIDTDAQYADAEWVQRELALPAPMVEQARQIIARLNADSSPA